MVDHITGWDQSVGKTWHSLDDEKNPTVKATVDIMVRYLRVTMKGFPSVRVSITQQRHKGDDYPRLGVGYGDSVREASALAIASLVAGGGEYTHLCHSAMLDAIDTYVGIYMVQEWRRGDDEYDEYRRRKTGHGRPRVSAADKAKAKAHLKSIGGTP